MPPHSVPPPDDWTTTPAKWIAVVILGVASITGIAYSILARQPHPRLWPASPPSSAPLTAAGRALGDPPPPPDTPAAPGPEPSPATRLININTATEAELQLLPGIGEAMARRIAEDRARRGPFRSVDNLDRVKGIGPETIRKLRPLVTVE